MVSLSLSLTPAISIHLLALIGGGEFSFGETKQVDELLVSRLDPSRLSVAFLPTASGSTEYARHFGAYLQTLRPELTVTNVPVYRGRDVRRPRNLAAIRNAGLVYIGGGSVSTLLSTIAGTPVEEALRDAAAAGAIIAGIGAGASAFGIEARDTASGAMVRGLGWLCGAVIEPAFSRSHDAGLRRLMTAQGAEIGLGIPSGSALLIRPDVSAEIAGDGEVVVFRKPPRHAGS